MNCIETKYYLNDFVDGFLIDEMRNEIRNHLDSCRGCRTYYIEEISILKEAAPRPQKLSSSRDIMVEMSEMLPKSSKKKSPRILSVNQSDVYTNFKSSKLIVKKKFTNSGWFAFGAALIVIILGVVLGLFYFFQ